MSTGRFLSELMALVESQGDEHFIHLALGELGLTYADEVPPNSRLFFIERVKALFAEAL